ncbi:MAG TPA: sugar ABC transporter ATP-binding protein [Acidimicrobiales bacterium]|nr:sugar ABC transporter ATP-binding protein [Acidimicrobiales bacterium]
MVADTEPGDRPGDQPGAGPALDVRGLSKSFANNLALDSLDLAIAPGEIHVLIGQNGSGKSTLIKVLSGYHVPDPGGTVHIAGEELSFGSAESSYRSGLRFVHQDLGLIPSTSILDNLALSSVARYPTRWGTIRERAARADARRRLEQVGVRVDPRETVSVLGAAQRTELAVARALQPDEAHPARLLVLDEPTATLPVDEVEHLLATVRNVAGQGVGILYVTHHLDEVFEIARRVSVLRDGVLVGTFDIEDVDRPTLIRHLTGGVVEEVRRDDTTITSAGSDRSLVVEDLSASTLRDVNLEVRPGEILGVAGLTGSGREAICRAVFGALERDTGRVVVAGREIPPGHPGAAMRGGIGFLPGDRKIFGGVMTMSARENLTLCFLRPYWKKGWINTKKESAEVKEWFTRLDARPAGAIESPLATFSGGNQQKILFGKWLRQELPFLLFDTPTQGIDVGAKAQLHRLLLDIAAGGTGVLVASTDTEELVTLCSRVVVLRGGRISEALEGADITPSAINHAVLSDTDAKQGAEQ